ncbi:MAG: peptidyl-tRNA hydrolase [Armatimonadetes bacterium]|nr:peptidyl-tRNA hydrolase [Armatimonadota bacterium]
MIALCAGGWLFANWSQPPDAEPGSPFMRLPFLRLRPTPETRMLVVGLGNPGAEYHHTRHNAGFLAIDRLAQRHEIEVTRSRCRALVGYGSIGSIPVALAEPQTFMNLSGESVVPLLRQLHLPRSAVLVITDDLDLPLGRIRIRANGSPGGHNGLKSLVHHLGTEEFPRIRVGIGRPPRGVTVVDHVLSPFAPEETEALQDAINRAAEAAEVVVTEGLDAAMRRFNGAS